MTTTKAESLAARLESGWCPIESPADMGRAAAELRRLAAVEAERDDLKLALAHTVRLVQDWTQSAYAMEAERDAMRADSERWRFALTQPYEFWKRIGFMGCAEDQNEAIDAAMKGTT